MPDDPTPAPDDDLVAELAAVIANPKAPGYWRDMACQIVAGYLVQRLQAMGFVFMRQAPTRTHTAG